MWLTDPLLVHPFWLERQIDPSSADFLPGSADPPRNLTHRRITTIGTLARPERAAVDPRGLVTPDHAAWSIDWWIGAEDHWHVPSRARTIRQRLLGGPVVETALRVPGGDVLHRAYGFLSTELGPCVAIEIENRSAVPVAVALAVRPYHPLGLTAVRSVAVDGSTVLVDDRPALLLTRSPAEVRVGDSRRGDVAGPLLAGDAGFGVRATQAGFGVRATQAGLGDERADAVSALDEAGRATAAVVSPLAHTAVLRAVIPLLPTPPARARGARVGPVRLVAPDAVPSAEQVAKGWDAQVRRGLAVELPDPRWQQTVDAAVAHLLLAHGGEDLTSWPAGPAMELADIATVLRALGQWGFAEEVAEVLATWPERQALDGAFASHDRRADAAGAALDAVAEHWRLTADSEVVESLVGPLAKAVRWIGKRRGARRAPRDRRAVGLLPDGGAPPGGGLGGTYLRDASVSARALATVADALAAAGQPEVAADARQVAADLRADLDATIATIGLRGPNAGDGPGGAPVPPTPSRSADPGIVVNVDLFEPFGALAADHPSAGPTLDAVRALPTGGVAAVAQLDGPAGLSPALTAQLAAVEIERADRRALDRIDWLVTAGGPTAVWPAAVHPRTGDGSWGAPQDPCATAGFLTAVRRMLVRELADGSGLALCSVVPPSWLGQSLDVRRASTAFGRFSFSVRWHGERPALLWELDPHPHVTDLRLTAPGLDPSWSASGLEGDALLAPVPPPMPEPDMTDGSGEPDEPTGPAGGLESPVVLRRPAAPPPAGSPEDGSFS